MPDLSILCVTRAEPEVRSLLRQLVEDAHSLGAECVIAADGREALATLLFELDGYKPTAVALKLVKSKGYLESVLDEALSFTRGDYVLRIDDDERMSREMVEWLRDGSYRTDDVWKFARAHLVCDDQHYIENLPLFPDHQTRLSIRHKAGGRRSIHCGSPFGGGKLAPVLIEHHKFIVKSLDTRRKIVERYESVQPGAGVDFWQFSVPEDNLSCWSVRPIAEAYEKVQHAS